MKYEWRKAEKSLYVPPQRPVIIDVPELPFFMLSGSGNPNDSLFSQKVEALYAVSYAIRMSHKKGRQPDGFFEYTVFPLEGVWDISEEAKSDFDGNINKNDLVYTIMIRQPDFVSDEVAQQAKEWAKEKADNPHIDTLVFDSISDGKCVQMMHVGSYDSEPESFAIMEAFCNENSLCRKSKMHKEIYLSDPRKCAPEKMKTVLRFAIE